MEIILQHKNFNPELFQFGLSALVANDTDAGSCRIQIAAGHGLEIIQRNCEHLLPELRALLPGTPKQFVMKSLFGTAGW